MHDYYIREAKSLAQEGKYEEALKDLSYLKPYYNEEEISKLEDEYNKYISNYTMTSDDIINLICRRSDENKNDLSVVSYLQTVNGKRYYYDTPEKRKLFGTPAYEQKFNDEPLFKENEKEKSICTHDGSNTCIITGRLRRIFVR